MKAMTHDLRKKIKMYIKNKLDISDLIVDYDVKGENLSRARIKNFERTYQDLSGIDLSYAILGEEGKITNLSGSKFLNSNFEGTKFTGTVYMRHCDCRGSNFKECWMHNVQYQYADLRNCNFCEAILRLGSDYGFRTKLDKNLFRDLAKHWNIVIKFKDEIEAEEKEKENKDEKRDSTEETG